MSTPQSLPIDQAKTFTETPTVVGAASGALVAANARRTAVIIMPPLTNTIYISSITPAITLQGIQLKVADPELVIDIERYGKFVTGAIFAIGLVGNQTVTVIEVFSNAG